MTPIHRMRCSEGQLGCGKRFTLARAPHRYARAVRCPNCSSLHVRSVNRAAINQTKRRKAAGYCYCGGYPFPHMPGTLRMCAQHKNRRPPTEREWAAYRRIIETPRGTVFQCELERDTGT